MGPKSGRSNSLKTSESTVNKKHVNSSYVNNGKLSCIYTNADQLNNKFNELQLLVKTHDPDIIAITEVKPKNCRFQPQIGDLMVITCGGQTLKTSLVEAAYYMLK